MVEVVGGMLNKSHQSLVVSRVWYSLTIWVMGDKAHNAFLFVPPPTNQTRQEWNAMRDFSPIYNLPNTPAVYAFYSGGRGPQYVAYVGIAGKLKQRIVQHLIRKDSSVATGASAVSLNPDQLTRMEWWGHPTFNRTVNLKAAEMVAFGILQPALRSRGRDDSAGKGVLADQSFRESMAALFTGKPSGAVNFLTLADALKRIDLLEQRVEHLEGQLKR